MAREQPVRSPADLVLLGGRILTSAKAGTWVEALGIRDGWVVAAGSDAEVRALSGPATRTVDLQGRTVVPGLIDSHIHAVRAGLTWDLEVRWDGATTLAEALERVALAAASRPAGSWIAVLGGWHPGQFAETRMPTRADLDRAAPDHAVVVQLLYDGVVLNGTALGRVGDIGADSAGWAPGAAAVQRCTTALRAPDPEREERATRSFLAELAGWGLTGVVDAGGFGMTVDRYDAVRALGAAGELPLRVRLFAGAANAGREDAEVEAWLAHLRSARPDTWLRAVGIGEIAVFGCHDGEGLDDRAFAPDALQRLERLTRLVAAEGRPLQLHAILDTSVGAILDVWERVDRDVRLGDLRFCLAHMEQVSRRNLERAAALGVVVAVQHRLALRAADTAPVWGEDDLRRAPPLRTMLDLGMPLAGGTDATRVSPPNPWQAIAWMVTGRQLDGGPTRDPEHCLSLLEALEAYTAGSALLSGEADERGRLEPGFRADLAVLSADCFSLPAAELPRVRSVLTLVAGEAVHASAGLVASAD